MGGEKLGISLVMGMVMIMLLSGMGAYSENPTFTSTEVTVIFQFGNQETMSANVYLPSDNHTAIKATELACEELGLYLNYSWSSYGVLVNQIGWEKNEWGVNGYYWHLMIWNNGSYAWEPSNVGSSTLLLKNGDVISWVYTVDNPSWVPYTGSLAYPGHYGVWSSPRGNFNNTAIAFSMNYTPDVVWKFKGSSSWGFSSSPISGDGEVFIADSSGLYALNANGSLIWNNTKGAAGYYGIASPILFGKYVIIGTSDQYLRAFYVNNGTLAWEFYLSADVASAPLVEIVNYTPTVFVSTFHLNANGTLYAINALNGTEEWNLTLMGSDYFGIPAFYDGKIIVPVAGIEDSSYTWNPPFGVQCINQNGTYAWNFTTSSSVRSSPVVENGTIYFVTVGGKMIALNGNGVEKWELNIGSSVSSPAVNGNVIYVGNNNGTLYAVDDRGTYGEILWERQLNGPIQAGIMYISGVVIAATNTQNGTLYATFANGTPFWNITLQPESYILSSPAIADSYILVASNNGYLYALGNNATYPRIESIIQKTAYIGTPVKIEVESSQQYQAILYYRNLSGDQYHAVWMQYENGYYVGYIPAQNSSGNLYYYVTLVNSSGVSTTSSIHVAQVLQPVPELNVILIPLLLLVIIVFRSRAHG